MGREFCQSCRKRATCQSLCKALSLHLALTCHAFRSVPFADRRNQKPSRAKGHPRILLVPTPDVPCGLDGKRIGRWP